MMTLLKLSEVVFRDDLYPRIKQDPALVQRYAENIEVLPPIEINQHNELIDGWHRWTAHKTVGSETIKVTITKTASDNELYALAIERNAKHGFQLTEKDKATCAIRLFNSGEGLTKERIAEVLGVTLRSVSNYLSNIEKQLREARKQKIFDMWLACYTQDEIAQAVGVSQDAVALETADLREMEKFPKVVKLASSHGDADFTPPIYNVWTFANKTNEVSHFGNSEQRILDNLLYLYTKPFDVVFDPFGGGGATIDVCQKRTRRYWVSDRKPIEARSNEIRQFDIADGLPRLPWSDVALTYLDPPYWRQAAGQYSKDAEDLANMPLEQFTRIMIALITQVASKQTSGAIAMLMQPTQWKADDRQFTDHIVDIVSGLRTKKLMLENRVSCPYSTEQCNAQMVQWAKDNKRLLVLSRELIVWRVA